MVLAHRKPNLFEIILLTIGIAVIVLGYIAIHRMVLIEKTVSWELLQTTFLWLLMIFFIVLAAVNENMKEELKVIAYNQLVEIRLLREEIRRK